MDDDLYETLRIESGIPEYGIDMDETTIVPELGLDGLISYNKGCYIGQEIIARIHFRGHVAKLLTGLLSEPGAITTWFLAGAELTTAEGKNAGRITSVVYSPKLDRNIALAFVRYDFLTEGTDLMVDDKIVRVKSLPFIEI
ncbi:MAG: glycine cleavage T C-terminal barrel domain-containing protein [Pyrinomonadaceae bacterium]